jgi:hypothetical protein
MIKIIEKKVEVVRVYDVEPKIATLYYVNPLDKDIVEYKNCVFKEATPVIYGTSDANKYRLVYENGTLFRNVIIDITTGKVKDDSEYFFDEAKAESIHKKLRIEYLKNRIDCLKEYQQEIKCLKNKIDGLKKYQKELEELENFEKKGGKV